MFSKMALLALPAAFLLTAFLTTFVVAQVVVYPAQDKSFQYHSDKFKITIHQNGKSYVSYVYQSQAPRDGGNELAGQFGKTFNFTTFSFQGTISIEVTKFNSSAHLATVRPSRLIRGPITAHVSNEGSTIQFSLNKPAKLSIEFDDDPGLKDGCLVFADPPENRSLIPVRTASNAAIVTDSNSLRSTNGKQVVIFKPGTINIGYWEVPASVKQIYFSGGSYVIGYLHAARETSNPLIINGKGILSSVGYPFWHPQRKDNPASPYITLYIEGGQGNLISDVTICDATNATVFIKGQNSTIDNIKIHGFRLNNDGITPVASNNLMVTNSFIHVNDDAVVIYGDNFTMTNCTFWQLGGGSVIQLGWRANVIHGTNSISDCDVLHAEWKHTDRNGGFVSAMNEFDNPTAQNSIVQNFSFRNIYFDTDVDRLVDIQMDAPRKKRPVVYDNFLFENIYFLNKKMNGNPLIYLSDYHDSLRCITNFVFKNIVINGNICSMDCLQQNNLYSTKTKAPVLMK
jgi:hypothetical protein